MLLVQFMPIDQGNPNEVLMLVFDRDNLEIAAKSAARAVGEPVKIVSKVHVDEAAVDGLPFAQWRPYVGY